MITFEKIRWKNFLSSGNSFLETDLNNNSTTLIFDGTENTRFRQKSFEFGKFPAFDRPNLGFSPPPFIKEWKI